MELACPSPKKVVTAIIGPRAVAIDVFALSEPHARSGCRARAPKEGMLDQQNIYDRDVDPVRFRGRVGMVFQKPNPFPTMSIRESAGGAAVNGVKLKDRTPGREGATGVALWDESKTARQGRDELVSVQQQRLGIARALAIEPEGLLRTSPVGPGTHRDRPRRGADPRAARDLHDRDRDPQHAAGGARREFYGVLLLGAAGSTIGRRSSHLAPKSSGPKTTSRGASADDRLG